MRKLPVARHSSGALGINSRGLRPKKNPRPSLEGAGFGVEGLVT